MLIKFPSNCGTTLTPLWRRAPDGRTICNACGLYLKARNTSRPVNLKRTQPASSPSGNESSGAEFRPTGEATVGTCPGGGRCNGTGGALGCDGCPAFNNRVAKSLKISSPSTEPSSRGCHGQPAYENKLTHTWEPNAASAASVSCQNCGTTITPLWRRDESGRTICNACGKR